MPSFSDFAGFEGFLLYSVGANRALPPDRGSAHTPAAIPSNLALVSQPKNRPLKGSADTMKDQNEKNIAGAGICRVVSRPLCLSLSICEWDRFI